jgi:hypothetical protein
VIERTWTAAGMTGPLYTKSPSTIRQSKFWVITLRGVV